jgi:DNA-binding SARP family transcriptional activator
VQELLCYLLLYRGRPHSREALASLQWGDNSTAQSKKYLRQALWQLQTALDLHDEDHHTPILMQDREWVQVDPTASLWLDVAVFERAFDLVRMVPGQQLDRQNAQVLRDAVDLYQGDLLEGWYQDWCVYERERLRSMYMAMLDKLIAHCETQHDYVSGLSYGDRILRLDRARERTHRRLMRLHFLAGNRTEALRQYDRCEAALKDELDVTPTDRTVKLREQIRVDSLSGLAPDAIETPPQLSTALLLDILIHLKQVQVDLHSTQKQVQQDIQTVQTVLNNWH